MKLGTCYFPEHWPEDIWADDARRMRDMGLSLVRIGEFAWSRIEPEAGRFDWGWLDRAIATLHDAGLNVMLCTPTATPPKWLVDQMPEMVAIDEQGRPRRFGSRRHYCFSHQGYRAQSRRITTALAQRYGDHPAITAWQTDNEYGCHDTVLSFSDAAAAAFRGWLERRYGDIDALNRAWGNVFWSMEYRSFGEVDPPHLTVTEANPAHWLDYRRFASDEVAAFNREQVDILRSMSPGRDITHNFMGFFTEFDHHDVARDLDVATWDSYPLGFLEQFWFSSEEKSAYLRQGHPDIAAFHHDLYRGCAKGRWGVMEQQPGPVNWARFNPAPLDGMVALWTLEAMAHGAEFTSYFRWRQAPFAQEQMHAGLLRPDGKDAPAAAEARKVAQIVEQIGAQDNHAAPVALVFSYEAAWVCSIQPQGQSFRYLELAFTWYSALRRKGLNIDIVSPDADLSDYAAIVIPAMPIAHDALLGQLADLDVPVLIGPRSGSKTESFSIPDGLAPGDGVRGLIPLRIVRVESLRDGEVEYGGASAGAEKESGASAGAEDENGALAGAEKESGALAGAEKDPAQGGGGWTISRWREDVETQLTPEFALKDGRGVVYAHNHIRYCAAWPDRTLLDQLVERIAHDAQITLTDLPLGVRMRATASHQFIFNYTARPVRLAHDGEVIDPAGVSITALKP